MKFGVGDEVVWVVRQMVEHPYGGYSLLILSIWKSEKLAEEEAGHFRNLGIRIQVTPFVVREK